MGMYMPCMWRAEDSLHKFVFSGHQMCTASTFTHPVISPVLFWRNFCLVLYSPADFKYATKPKDYLEFLVPLSSSQDYRCVTTLRLQPSFFF